MADNENLPRFERVAKLPSELTDSNSKIGWHVRVSAEAFEGNFPVFNQLQSEVQRLARCSCPHYKPDSVAPEHLMCASGSNGHPFIGKTCALGNCQLSQVVMKDGKFCYIGPEPDSVPVEDKLLAKIFPPQVGE